MVVFYDMQQDEVKEYSNFHLSIEVSSEFLNLLLIDKQSESTIAREIIEVSGKLESTFQKSEIISLANPNSVSCSVVNNHFTLVPSAIFVEKELDTFLNFGTTLQSNTKALYTEVKNKEIVICFGLEKEVIQVIINAFPQVQFMHQASVLIKSLSDGLHVNFNNTYSFEIVKIDANKLVFYNQYQAETPEETMYYLGLVAEKLGLNIQKERIKISGKIDSNGDILSFWNQFIPAENCTFNEIETSQVNVVSTHHFFTLNKQFQCV